jgi:hypothetical protein
MPATDSLLEQVIVPRVGDMPPAVAEYVLSLHFPPKVHTRCARLSRKANRGTLTEKEAAELDRILNLNDFLSLLQVKARASLKRRSPAA